MSNQVTQLKKPNRTYLEYVDSGIEWIGQVPKGWEVIKLNHSAKRITSGGTPNRGNENFYDGDIPWVVTGELRDGYINETKNLITKTGLVNSSAKMFKKGTVLIALYGATIGKLGILNIDASTNQACCAIDPQTSKLNPRFLFYALLSARQYLISLAYGGGQPNISQNTIKGLWIPLPSTNAQQKIIDYLDEKVGKIEDIVAKKRKQIELLKEKRAATIARAVTRGLDPDAELVNSGVEWIGRIPKGWEVKKLKYISEFQSGDGFKEELQGRETGDFPFYKVSDINGPGRYVDTAANYINQTDVIQNNWHVVRTGSLLMAKIGAALLKNHRKIAKVDCIVDNNMLAVFPRLAVEPDFFYWLWFNIDASDFQNISSVPSVNMEMLRNSIYSIPPSKPEQQKIADYLDEQNKKIDAIIQKIEQSVQLLQEYKTSLISSAVRGRVKV